MVDLKNIESLTSLPEITVSQELSQKANVLLSVLTENDLTQHPSFLKVLGTSSLLTDDLKKKKKFVFYGGQDDKYGICHVRLVNFGTTYEILEAAGDQTRALLAEKPNSVVIYFPDSVSSEHITTFLTGVVLTNYKHNRKSEESAQFKRIAKIEVVHKSFDLKNEKTDFALRSAQYTLFCRELLSLRALDANPETMLALCQSLAKIDSKISIETIVGKELQEKGLNLIYSVGRGAAKPPCLAILRYDGNPNKKDDVIAWVGKGVCFDAGGLNLKPTGAIEEMWCDKGGACTVLAAFKAVVEMKLPVNIVCSVALVENLVGSDAYHPSDIIKSHKGLTVEIGNTDAEGRLILCDAMSYTQQKHKPHTLIEFSTLTGAVRIALGLTTAGLFSNSDELVNNLMDASTETCERLWRLPVFEEHRNYMKGVYADLNNIGGKGMGGASNAAAFLEKFVEQGVNWAHIDIAGTALSGEKFIHSEGATGYGVRLLLSYLRNKISKA